MQLLRTILMRLATTAITLIGVAVIVFVVIRVVPGNPIAMMLPPGATDKDIARLTSLYGFDKSIPQHVRVSFKVISAPRSRRASRFWVWFWGGCPRPWNCRSWRW
jgi:hypothetical protein